MSEQVNINELTLLLNENSLSESAKKEIARKINNILDFLDSLTDNKTLDSSLITEIKVALQKEQKITARMIVKKNDALSKDLIKSLTIQKENSLQVLEISQLRLEAELKKLKSQTYPSVKAENSLFSKIFGLLKINFTSKKTTTLKSRIDSTTTKLNDLEKQKESLSLKFGTTGKEALQHLNKITYNSFMPVLDTSSKNIETIKNKITFLK